MPAMSRFIQRPSDRLDVVKVEHLPFANDLRLSSSYHRVDFGEVLGYHHDPIHSRPMPRKVHTKG